MGTGRRHRLRLLRPTSRSRLATRAMAIPEGMATATPEGMATAEAATEMPVATAIPAVMGMVIPAMEMRAATAMEAIRAAIRMPAIRARWAMATRATATTAMAGARAMLVDRLRHRRLRPRL